MTTEEYLGTIDSISGKNVSAKIKEELMEHIEYNLSILEGLVRDAQKMYTEASNITENTKLSSLYKLADSFDDFMVYEVPISYDEYSSREIVDNILERAV